MSCFHQTQVFIQIFFNDNSAWRKNELGVDYCHNKPGHEDYGKLDLGNIVYFIEAHVAFP